MLGKLLVLALVAASALAAASGPMSYPTRTGDMDMLMKQKRIYELLMYVSGMDLMDAEYYAVGRTYDIYNNVDLYTNKEVVMNFLMRYKLGMLHKDAIFSYYNHEHRMEMIMLYKLFYFAKDFETFYKTASWARIHMNPGMFTTAFTTAVIYRDDCKFLRLPAINEIYPYMFFDFKLIREAYKVAMTSIGHTHMNPHMSDGVETYHLYHNFTDLYTMMMSPSIPMMEENKLAYFTDDVSLNSYYYYMRMIFPFWMDTKDYNVPKTIRGDLYYFLHQQILARYMLERYSNGLGEMAECSWNDMCMPAYQSNLVYGNGVPMPRRDWWNVLPWYKHKYAEFLKKLEIRIMEAIDSGYVVDEMGKQIHLRTPEGLNMLGNLIEGNYDSVNMKYYSSWEALARKVYGMNIDSDNKNLYVPSALEIFSTSMKDPAFYRIIKKMVDMVLRCKSHIMPYTMNELELSGVRIENVEMDRLVTFWERKDYLINNVVDVPTMKDGKSFNIKAWQWQLNHKPFSYKMNIDSVKSGKAMMRIFLGPAVEGDIYDSYSYLLNYYQYFFMLDEFEVDLKEGMNNIIRHSTDSMLFMGRHMTGDKFYSKLMHAMEGKEPMNFNSHYGFPDHMMLPKGSVDGMRFKLFFYIGPYEHGQVVDLPILGKRMMYGKSIGFPLDRPMQPYMLKLGNVFLKDVMIYNVIDNDMIMMDRSENMGYGSMMKDMFMMKGMNHMDHMDHMNMNTMHGMDMDMMHH